MSDPSVKTNWVLLALAMVCASGVLILAGVLMTQPRNPFADHALFVEPDSPASRAAAAVTDPRGRDVFGRLAAEPTAVWLVPERHPAGTVGAHVASLAQAAASADAVPVFVLYGIPDRDCGGHSRGGLAPADYEAWVREIAEALGGRPAAVIVEPDALAPAGQCDDYPERIRQIRIASQLLGNGGATVYLDGGHSRWQPVEVMAQLLRDAGVESVRGFATNVSNFNDHAAEREYAETLSAQLGGAHYVIDTSRNGRGSNGEWCNPRGRALGERPRVVGDGSREDAMLWIKVPGESDGECNGGPPAGHWWDEAALELARNAGW